MGVLEVSIIAYALWLLVTVMVVFLWIAALSEIKSPRSGLLFTNAMLTSMAVAISIVAVSAIVFVTVVSFPSWKETTPVNAASICVDQAKSYVFSFGLEYAVYTCTKCEGGEDH